MKDSIRNITNIILEIEKTHNLFEWEINGVFVWEIIRTQIYSKALFHLEPPHEKTNISLKKFEVILSKIFYKVKRYLNAIVFNPFFDFVKTDVIIFESSRKVLFEGEYIDPHTKFLYDELVSDGNTISRYQSSFSYDKLSKRSLKVKHLDLIYLISFFKINFTKSKLLSEDFKKIKLVEDCLYTEFEVAFKLRKMIQKEIKFFKSNSIFFDKLLKRKKPKEIYIVNFCDKAALISQAKEKNIKVIDIQHGLISADDVIYHYPNSKEGSLKYFPDQFYAWSKVWQEICKIPLRKENIIIYGNKYLINQSKKFNCQKKNTKQILIISQPGLTQQIADFVLQNYSSFVNMEIIYKLHPSEYSVLNEYQSLLKLKNMPNVSFASKLIDLYELFAKVEFVGGVCSVALIEAITFNCKILLFDLPGVEMMEPFINDTTIKIFNKNDMPISFG